MSIIQGSAMQGASRGFYPKELTGSLRFNDDDSAYLSWTPDSAGNRKTWTWSGWVKLGTLGTNRTLLSGGASSSDRTYFGILADNQFRFVNTISGTSTSVEATLLLRDPSAWYHIVVACDTTQATAADRLSLYINGEEITAFDQTGYPAQNANTQISNNNIQTLGSLSYSSSNFWDGYMAEVFFLDGQSKAGSDFGETKNGVWVPKDITASDFTMGTNGFHLTFEDDTEVEAFNTVIWSGDDVSGRQVTGVGFNPDLVWTKSRSSAVNHVLMDSVRGPNLRLESNTTDAEDVYDGINSFDSDGFSVGVQTGVNDVGKTYVAWCWDAGANNASTGHSSVTWKGSGSDVRVSGLPFRPDLVWAKSSSNGTSHALFDSVRGVGKMLNTNNTVAEISNSQYGYLDSFDKDGFHFQVGTSDGTYGTFSGHEYVAWCWDAGDSDPVSNTTGDTTATVKTNGDFSICAYSGTGAATSIGHGLSSAPNFVIVKDRSAAQNWVVWTDDIDTDGNQYLELNSTQGTQSSSVFWNSTAPDANKIYLGTSNSVSGRNFICYAWRNVTGKQKFGSYTGNGSADGPEVTLGFRPGFVMLKRTNDTSNWRIYDSSRNPLNDVSHDLYPDTSDSEGTTDAIRFTDDGFKLVFAGGTGLNTSGSTYIYAAFAGSYSDYITDYNTDGSIDSRVKASDTTGFSIVSYVGTGANATVGHGLSAAPDMIIVKRREAASAWEVQHSALGAVANQDISLNETTGAASGGVERWHQLPTSSVFSVGTGSNTNASGEGMIAYCWTATTGVSSFGSYTGNGTSTGPTVTTGFKPAFLMIKRTDSTHNWYIFDSTRTTTNPQGYNLMANSSAAEDGPNNIPLDFLSNGFQPKGDGASQNASGGTYIYAAFADTRDAAFWLDQSGNDNDWQPVNLDHNDTVSDSPVDNFATMSPITVAQGQAQATLSNGNLKVDLGTPGSSVAHTYGTMAIPSSGQYYFEATFSDVSGGPRIGISVVRTTGNQSRYVYISSGQKIVGTSASSYGDSYAAGDTIGVAVDVDASTIEFYKNGTGQGSFSIDLTASTGGSASDYFPFITNGSGTSKSVVEFNFGQQPFKYGPPE